MVSTRRVVSASVRVVSLYVVLNCVAAARQVNIDYAKLAECQQVRFQMPGGTGNGVWVRDLDDSQRLEYAGGTQALIHIKMQSPQCLALWRIDKSSAISGSLPGKPSQDQFNIQVAWLTQSDLAFKQIKWQRHIALLHPGQYGYQETRGGNPFHGLVVLFDDDDPRFGQFHIDFRTFLHYFPDNGNIAKNYEEYCDWYGKIDGYSGDCSSRTAVDWRSSDHETGTLGLSTNPSSVVEVVSHFLTEWYVNQNLDGLIQYVAEDNMTNWVAKAGRLPQHVERVEWDSIFSQAFVGGPGAVRFRELSTAIKGNIPKGVEFTYLTAKTPEAFRVVRPTGLAEQAYFPPKDVPQSDLDDQARFLRHLLDNYARPDEEHTSLYLVIFVNAGKGLVNEGCVLYWIKEKNVWKLAAFVGTD